MNVITNRCRSIQIAIAHIEVCLSVEAVLVYVTVILITENNSHLFIIYIETFPDNRLLFGLFIFTTRSQLDTRGTNSDHKLRIRSNKICLRIISPTRNITFGGENLLKLTKDLVCDIDRNFPSLRLLHFFVDIEYQEQHKSKEQFPD